MKKIILAGVSALTLLASLPASAAVFIQPTFVEPAPVYAAPPPPPVYVAPQPYGYGYGYPYYERHHRYDWRYWHRHEHDEHWDRGRR